MNCFYIGFMITGHRMDQILRISPEQGPILLYDIDWYLKQAYAYFWVNLWSRSIYDDLTRKVK